VTIPLHALRQVRVADVYKAGVRAATLSREPEGVAFAYVDGYRADNGGRVATTLPLSDQPIITPAGAVPAFFAGLLPEGRRLSSLRRAVKTSADDELSLLLAVGRDAIGDVQVVPEGEEPTPAEPLVSVEKSWSEIRFDEVLQQAGIDRVGIPGVQEKVSARMISAPVGQRTGRYLLKMNPPEFPLVVENEAFFLDLASRVDVPAAEATIVRDANDQTGLLVRRFDRARVGKDEVQALAAEDACQVLGRWPADKYNVTSEEVVTALANECASRTVAVRDLFRQLCFAWLTGNGDVHAKNLSILATPQGEWRVSPAYDVPSTVPYGDTTLALSIGGSVEGISRKRWLAFANDVGLRETAAIKVMDGLVAGLAELESQLSAGSLPFDKERTHDLVGELRHRRRLVGG
jgi:serine/threonine-protein kinase HipA